MGDKFAMGDVRTTEERRENVRNGLLALAAVLVIAVLIWALSQESNRYEREATDRSHRYAREAEREIANSCALQSPANRPECVKEAKQAARTNQREERDLAAQMVTAWWTRIMGAAALVGAVLSTFGVFLVWTTFRQTRKQAHAAMEMLQIERGRSKSDVRLQVEFGIDDTPAQPMLVIVAKSHGGGEAGSVEVSNVTVSTSDDRFKDLPLTYVIRKGPDRLSNPGASRQFKFGAQQFVFPLREMRRQAFDNIEMTVRATLEFMDSTGGPQRSEEVWAGKLAPVSVRGNPPETLQLQAHFSREK